MPEMDGIHRPAIQLAGSESDEFFPHIAPPDRSIRTHGNIHRIVFGKIEVAKWRKAAARILPDPPGLLHEKIPASAAAYGMAFSYGQSIDRIQVEDITPCQDHVQRQAPGSIYHPAHFRQILRRFLSTKSFAASDRWKGYISFRDRNSKPIFGTAPSIPCLSNHRRFAAPRCPSVHPPL